MQHLILKTDIEQSKLQALIVFLKSWNIDAELKFSKPITKPKKTEFNLSAGIWSDYAIDAKELRAKSWSRNK